MIGPVKEPRWVEEKVFFPFMFIPVQPGEFTESVMLTQYRSFSEGYDFFTFKRTQSILSNLATFHAQ